MNIENLKQNLILNLRLTLTVCVKIRICYNDWCSTEWKDHLHKSNFDHERIALSLFDNNKKRN
jgi:hypothetical protein